MRHAYLAITFYQIHVCGFEIQLEKYVQTKRP